MAPYYRTAKPDERIVLYDGDAQLISRSGTSEVVNGVVSLDWSPRPETNVGIAVPGNAAFFAILNDGNSVAIKERNSVVPAQFTHRDERLVGVLGGTVRVGGDSAIKHLFFHLTNCPQFHGEVVACDISNKYVAGRFVLEAQGWRIVVDPAPHIGSLVKSLKHSGGHAITHVARAERVDGSTFSPADAEDLLDALYHFLSFCLGRWCPPILSIEFDESGRVVAEEWGTRIITPWQYVSCCTTDRSSKMITAIFVGFLERWCDPLWKDSLRRATWWYVSANLQEGGVDGGIILAQVALELIAWVLFVEAGHVISTRGFEDLPTADKLRLLVDKMRVSPHVPAELTALSAFKTKEKVAHAAYKFVEIRNALVHPKNRKSIDNAVDAIIEAWELGMWFTELALLFICGYPGDYVNRNVARFAGEVDRVPWAT